MTPSERALLLLLAEFISRTQFSAFYPEERRRLTNLLTQVAPSTSAPFDPREE